MSGDRPSGTMTFLFTDIEGSTRLFAVLADGLEKPVPGAWPSTRRRLREIEPGHVRAIVQREAQRLNAVGLDEVLSYRHGQFRHRSWSTQVVDVARGKLLDVVSGRAAASSCAWFADRPADWVAQIRWATLDLSGRIGRCLTRCSRTPPRLRIPSRG